MYKYLRNELTGGIIVHSDGTHHAFTKTIYRNFKTFKGANKWLNNNGYKLVSTL